MRNKWIVTGIIIILFISVVAVFYYCNILNTGEKEAAVKKSDMNNVKLVESTAPIHDDKINDNKINIVEEEEMDKESDSKNIELMKANIPENENRTNAAEEKTEKADESEEPYVRDRFQEREDGLEEGIVIDNPEAIINEAYLPEPHLSGEELDAYMERIFLDICRSPDKIDNYRDVFTKESIDRFKEIEWVYDNPKEFYDFAIGYVDDYDSYSTGNVVVDSQYAAWDGLDEEKEAEIGVGMERWAYSAYFDYDPKSGIIEIRLNELFISIW